MADTAERTNRYDIALLLLRAIVGAVFVAHGAQKLFSMFGGQGLDAVAASMAASGLEPGMFFAVLAGVLEFGGGLLLLVGLLTPFAALILVGIMIVAIATVTGPSGFVVVGGVGYEFNLVLMVASIALAIAGAGRLSLDHWFGLDLVTGKRARQWRQQVTERSSHRGVATSDRS
jgi:putative oxidoreductase